MYDSCMPHNNMNSAFLKRLRVQESKCHLAGVLGRSADPGVLERVTLIFNATQYLIFQLNNSVETPNS